MAKKNIIELFEQTRTLMHDLSHKIDFVFDEQYSRKELETLMYISHGHKARLKDISERIEASNSSLCTIFSKMEKHGLVDREIDPVDRRNTYYAISAKGKEVASGIIIQRDTAIQKLFATLSDEEMAKVIDVLELINKVLARKH